MPIELSAGTDTMLSTGTRIRLEGIGGTVADWPGGISATGGRYRGFRAPAQEDTSFQFRAALDELDIIEQETIQLDVAAAYRFRASAASQSPANDQMLVVAAPPLRAGAAQVILYQDESGGMSWHFPDGFRVEAAEPATAFRALGEGATFTIPTRTAVAQASLAKYGGSRFRGLMTKAGRKIFKVFAIPLLDPLLAKPVEWLGRKVEARYRQELIRSLTPENYRSKESKAFADWEMLKGKRSLLFLHGLFSTTEGTLAAMPRDWMAELNARYEGRIISLDQLTVSRSPEENALTLLDALPREGHFEFDILCHSRGGIVARTLAERSRDLAPHLDCAFPRVFFVAAPNRGSVLADSKHMVQMIDVFTNLITSFPDGPVNYSIEVILAIVKLLATTGERHLPGLAAMSPSGYIRDILNRPGGRTVCRYAAAAADYKPGPLGTNDSFASGQIGSMVIGRVFQDGTAAVANDLVVPYLGVFGENGNPLFPITDVVSFGSDDHVWHSSFFSEPRTLGAIKRHFTLPDIGGRRFRGRPIAAENYGEASVPITGHNDFQTELPDDGGLTREIRRMPEMEFREQVCAGMQYDLPVRLNEIQTVSAMGSLAFTLEGDASQVEVDVFLRAPGFDIVGNDSARITLKAEPGDRKKEVIFQVKARDPGPRPKERELTAEFWYRNACVGAVRRRTIVLPVGADSGPVAGQKKPFSLVIRDTSRTSCDICLTITGVDDPDKPPFLMSLYSETPGCAYRGLPLGKFAPDTSDQPLAEYLTAIYNKQFERLPGAAGPGVFEQWEAQFHEDIVGLGRKLWKTLPERFRNLYLEWHAKGFDIRSILISSSEMVVPWELIIPQTADGKSLPPLGSSHILGRWKPGLPMLPEPQRYCVRRFCVLNPLYVDSRGQPELPAAAQEADDLCKFFSKAERIEPADFLTVQREVLKCSDVSFIHFSGHGEYDVGNPDLSSIKLLNNGSLSALALCQNFADSTPFIYLNACSAGATGRVAGRMGGFAANLLDNGCSGIIAPYWPVEDERARKFALALYQKLSLERSVGEALQELRAEMRDDITFQAFTYFGDPWARLDFGNIY